MGENIIITEPVAAITRSGKRVEKTRRKLMAAALEVFSEYGVDLSTIDDITQRADLGKGTFYRHFKDKKGITTCLVEAAVDRLVAALAAFNVPPTAIEDVLEHLLNVHYRFFMEHNDEFLLIFQGRLLVKLDGRSSDHMETPLIHYLQQIENMLSPFVSAKIEIMRVRQLACAVAGFVSGFFSFAMIGMDMDELETNMKPLRQSFVKSLSAFLAH